MTASGSDQAGAGGGGRADRAGTQAVLVERVDATATVTLNRPEVRNAINGELRRQLRRAMVALEADADIAVVVLTGADPAFCAGLDLREVGRGNPDVIGDQTSGSTRPWAPMSKPVIGAVNGPAITGGFELALNCDLLIASERAAFADTHARVGVMPGWGLTPLLVDAVGVRRAREISLSGNFVSADLAERWGLVNRVVAHDELLPTVYALAADIAGNDQAGVRRMLATYAEQTDDRLATAWRLEGEASAAFRGEIEFRPAEVEARRQAILERGRSQL
ncbi:MAG: enoyl-CoA hydratase [Actinomycetota bacterium]